MRKKLILLIFMFFLFLDCNFNQNIKIKILNNSNNKINEIYIVKSDINEWGNNLLDKPLITGESKLFVLDIGSYNIKIVAENSNYQILKNISTDMEISYN